LPISAVFNTLRSSVAHNRPPHKANARRRKPIAFLPPEFPPDEEDAVDVPVPEFVVMVSPAATIWS
jgi:hypothetical protein